MAVELCKVNLWLEALEPGKPLSFLDAHIQCGNSLLGTTPALIAMGLPDEAFVPLEGDDRSVVADLKKRNKKERAGTGRQKSTKAISTPLFSGLGTSYGPLIDNLAKEFEVLEAVEDSTLAAIHAKETRYKAMHTSEGWKHAKLVADAWCAAFVWEKTKARLNDEEGAVPITHDDLQRLIESPVLVSAGVRAEVERLAESYCFLHPHIAFPHVFQSNEGVSDWAGGFDVVLGNPPWERIKIQEREWFATRHIGIAGAPNASARKRLIQDLKDAEDPIFDAFAMDLRKADGESHIVRNSGAYPLCGQGDINTYSVFAELMRRIVAPNGQVGVVVPAGIATDDTTKTFFKAISSSQTLASLFSFENEEFLFPGVHHSAKFSLLTMAGPLRHYPSADFVCFARQVEHIQEPDRRFSLSGKDLELLNPNTGTCAVFRSRQDAELTKAIYRHVPVLIREAQRDEPEVNPWGLNFMAMLHMANDSGLFRSEADLHKDGWRLEGNHFLKGDARYLPLFEAKMLHHFDHRFGNYEGQTDAQRNQGKLPEVTPEQHADPNLVTQPFYWVPEREVKLRAAELPRSVLKALESGKEDDLAKALATWAFGAALLAEGEALPIPGKILAHVWQCRFATISSFRTLDATDLEHLKGLAQAKEYPFSEADQAILESHPTAQDAGEALLESRTPRWFLGWRRISLVTNQRTFLSSILPRSGVGDSFFLMFSKISDPRLLAILVASMSAYVFDYVVRQKMGGSNLNYFLTNQLACLPPNAFLQSAPWASNQSVKDWMLPRVLELIYTAWDLQPFAQDCGYDGPPFIWNEERRFQLRCELDAAFFHLYGLTYEEVAYVMGTFPIVQRKDEVAYGSYRTRDAILTLFAAMDQAGKMGNTSDSPTGFNVPNP